MAFLEALHNILFSIYNNIIPDFSPFFKKPPPHKEEAVCSDLNLYITLREVRDSESFGGYSRGQVLISAFRYETSLERYVPFAKATKDAHSAHTTSSGHFSDRDFPADTGVFLAAVTVADRRGSSVRTRFALSRQRADNPLNDPCKMSGACHRA